MLASMHPALDGAVILLEHVIRHWPMPAILGQTAFGFELRDGGRIRGVAIGVDHSWSGMVRTAQRFEQKAATASCLAERRKSRVAPLESTAR